MLTQKPVEETTHHETIPGRLVRPRNHMAIAVAVSGGTDSLYALASLAESGHKVMALHARFLPPDLAPTGYEAMQERLRAVCDSLQVPLHMADCAAAFTDAVISPFVRAYAAGQTPNPCAHCNARMKFGLLLDEARRLGASRLATGHYARLEHGAGGQDAALYAGSDKAKDQSYFLALVAQERLNSALFPLADKRKDDIRAWLAARNLTPPAPAESQEICFVPADAYRPFVLRKAAELGITLPGPGAVRLADGTSVGQHKGLWQYTEGQRRGLGIAWKEPLYVLAKDIDRNTLLVGEGEAARDDALTVSGLNCLVPFDQWPETLLIRTRYRQAPREATARWSADGQRLLLQEKDPSGPYAKGQLAVMYRQELLNGRAALRVLAGGIIS